MNDVKKESVEYRICPPIWLVCEGSIDVMRIYKDNGGRYFLKLAIPNDGLRTLFIEDVKDLINFKRLKSIIARKFNKIIVTESWDCDIQDILDQVVEIEDIDSLLTKYESDQIRAVREKEPD